MSKTEVEKELEGKGDFVKIDYLTRFLKESLSFDMKKFAYLKLAEIYERRCMENDAAKVYGFISNLSIPFTDKIKFHLKEAEMYIKAGMFDGADEAMKKALGNANASQKAEITFSLKDFYKRQALVYEKEKRRNQAVKIYEKLATMNITETEREEIKNKLLEMYEKLGKIKEYMMLKGK